MIGDPLIRLRTNRFMRHLGHNYHVHKTVMNGKSLTIVEVLLNVKVDIDEYNSISINM